MTNLLVAVDCHDAEDLAKAVSKLVEASGERAHAVYLRGPIRLTLEEERLSDNSVVHNIRIEGIV